MNHFRTLIPWSLPCTPVSNVYYYFTFSAAYIYIYTQTHTRTYVCVCVCVCVCVSVHFSSNPIVFWSLGSSDRTVSTLLAAQPSNHSSIPSTSKGLISFPKGRGQLSRYNKIAIQLILEAVSQGVKQLGPETDFSPPSGKLQNCFAQCSCSRAV